MVKLLVVLLAEDADRMAPDLLSHSPGASLDTCQEGGHGNVTSRHFLPLQCRCSRLVQPCSLGARATPILGTILIVHIVVGLSFKLGQLKSSVLVSSS